jgi:hypothetical protein
MSGNSASHYFQQVCHPLVFPGSQNRIQGSSGNARSTLIVRVSHIWGTLTNHSLASSFGVVHRRGTGPGRW